MNYYELVKEAKAKGLTNERKFMELAQCTSILLEEIKESQKETYTRMMRMLHRILFDNHYSEELAQQEVKGMCYVDLYGNVRTGDFWSQMQVNDITDGLDFEEGTTEEDKYVAYNLAYSLFANSFDEKSIAKIAYHLFFSKYSVGNIYNYMSKY